MKKSLRNKGEVQQFGDYYSSLHPTVQNNNDQLILKILNQCIRKIILCISVHL